MHTIQELLKVLALSYAKKSDVYVCVSAQLCVGGRTAPVCAVGPSPTPAGCLPDGGGSFTAALQLLNTPTHRK